MAPQRAAVLAVCLLALAAGTSAAPAPCAVGYFNLDVIEATGAAARSEIGRCLTSLRIDATAACLMTITPRNGGVGNFVQTLWKATGAPSTYNSYTECPTDAGPQSSGGVNAATDLAEAFNDYVYGVDMTLTGNSAVTTVAFQTGGTVLVTFGAGTLTYAVTETNLAAGAMDTLFQLPTACTGTTLSESTDPTIDDANCVEYDNAAEGLATICPSVAATGFGRYGIVLGNNLVKICALCPAGTVGDGYVCTPCDAGTTTDGIGKLATSGTSTCDACAAGTYAPAGGGNIGATSAANVVSCLPCPAGTYAGSNGAATCTECPLDAYAWIPGADRCVQCSRGLPYACTTGGDCSGNTDPISPGSHVLTSAALATGGCGLPTTSTDPYYVPLIENGCITTDLSWAFEVAGDCSITIYPIGIPTAVDATNDLCTDPSGTDFGLNVYRAYYHWDHLAGTPAFVIRSVLDTPTAFARGGAGDSGIMVGIDGTATAGEFDITWFAASTKTDSEDATVNPVNAAFACTTTLTIAGGSIITPKASATPITTCPAGSYLQTDNGLSLSSGTGAVTEYCWKCPVGYYCAGGSDVTVGKTVCTAGRHNPYLGRPTACSACVGGTLPTNPDQTKTSYEGSTVCDVPWLDNCNFASITPTNKAQYYDAATQTCVDCPAGTYRDDASQSCIDCPAGTYSVAANTVGEGVQGCLPCPEGQYNPSLGLGDQEAVAGGLAGQKCLLCPEGSVAKIAAGAPAIGFTVVGTLGVLTAGATSCSACPAGSIQTSPGSSIIFADSECTRCAAYTYRQGAASPENNVCLNIPAGYRLTTAGDRTALSLCDAGTVSWWAAGTRYPNGDVGATVAGKEALCLHCAAGAAAPSGDSDAQMPQATWGHTYAPRAGMSQCIPCPAGSIPFTTLAAGVSSVMAGGPKTDACIVCGDGFYRPASQIGVAGATCSDCGNNGGKEVGPSGKVACTLCRPGSYMPTNAAPLTYANYCTKCEDNTYRATPGGTSCTLCPKGTDTQDQGNTECTPCPAGWFNGVPGEDCEQAPPGTYTNTTGNWFPVPCPKGTWNDETGMDSCNVCPAGKYASTLGSRSCKTCPAGTFSKAQSASCTNCRAGYFAPVGSSNCQACRAGFYAPQPKSPFCIPCLKGYQCPTSALSATVACPSGTYSNKEGQKMCTPCPVNTISTQAGSAAIFQCTKCTLGMGTRGLTGQTVCSPLRPQVRRLRLAF